MEVGNGSRPVSAGKQIAVPVLTRMLLGIAAGMTSGNNGREDRSLPEKICDPDIPDKVSTLVTAVIS